MPVRGLVRTPTVKGAVTPTNCPIYCDSDDNYLKYIPAGTGSTEVSVPVVSGAYPKIAAGLGTFVSGAVTVATGLAAVTSFQATLIATGFATGATEVTALAMTAAPGATGAVSVQGYRLFTTTASASGTGTFHWVAVGA